MPIADSIFELLLWWLKWGGIVKSLSAIPPEAHGGHPPNILERLRGRDFRPRDWEVQRGQAPETRLPQVRGLKSTRLAPARGIPREISWGFEYAFSGKCVSRATAAASKKVGAGE